jgi:hypothetical protein
VRQKCQSKNRVREIIAVCDLKVSRSRQTGWKDFRGRRCTKVGVVVVVPFGFAAKNCEIVERAETIDDRQILPEIHHGRIKTN